LFATDVAEARGLRVTAQGEALVSSPRDGQVILLEADRDDNGLADGRRILVDGLNDPTGLDIAGASLYMGEEDAVGRIGFDSAARVATGIYQRILDGLPPGGNHWEKTVRVGPDGLLCVAVGSGCNVCVEEDERRAALLRYTASGTFVDIYATDLRNRGGFDWSPSIRGVVRDRQRTRHAGRRLPAVRAHRDSRGWLLRLALPGPSARSKTFRPGCCSFGFCCS